MNVGATVALKEVHVCSRIAPSNSRLKLQFATTTRTTARIIRGTMHRASFIGL